MAVGTALARSSVPRADVWVTTKLLQRAERAGCPAVAITVDLPAGRNPVKQTLLRWFPLYGGSPLRYYILVIALASSLFLPKRLKETVTVSSSVFDVTVVVPYSVVAYAWFVTLPLFRSVCVIV